MDIRSHRYRNSIGRKIFITNLTTLGITLTVVFLAFSLLIPVYFRQSTRVELKKTGQEILRSLDTLQTLEAGTATDRQKRLQLLRTLQEIRVAGRLISARMALVDEDGQVRLTNVSDLQPEELQRVVKRLQSARSGYVYVKLPFQSAETGSSGTLYLFAKTEDVSGVNRGVFLVLSGSLLLGGILAFLLGLLQQQRIRKPLTDLVSAVEDFSPRTFVPLTLETQDEIQALAEAFNRMAATLRQSDEAQIRLLQDISHELKTPLMSVQGYAEAIKDGVIEGADAEKSLDVIIHESQRLKRLVEELLLLTRLENQESSYAFRPCSVSETLKHAIDAVGGYARDEGVELLLEVKGECTAIMDPDRMIQCLVNILGNGIRYASRQVSISLEGDGSSGVLRIADDGRGFDPGEADRIFDRFYKGSHGNAGIGLTIAKAVCDRHGASLTAGNLPGGGAEFTLTLPCTPHSPREALLP